MRENLYRGKETGTKRWYYGGFFLHKKTTFCFKEDYDAHPDNDVPCIVFDSMTDWGLPNQIKIATVIPETVGQFTGFFDKNGQKIFEGDILEWVWTINGIPGRVVLKVMWDDGAWAIGHDHPEDQLRDRLSEGCAVIGNIHDNPELLEACHE